MASDTINARVGDLLLHVESLEYCTKTCIIRNGAGSAVDFDSVLGLPLKAGASGADYTLAVSGDEANVLALLLDGPLPLALNATSNSGSKYQVLKRAPAIINQDAIATADGAGALYVQATLRTALTALGFELRTEPTKSTTQST